MRNYGQSVMLKPLGSPSVREPIAITGDAANPTEITLATNKNHMEIYNASTGDIYWGGANVTTDKGIPIFSDYSREFNNCEDSFKVYLKCKAGENSEARIIEYA